VKGGKDDGGGVFCCSIGAKRRRVGNVGEDGCGRTGDESGPRREFCWNASGNNCSRDKVDCFFAGEIGTFC